MTTTPQALELAKIYKYNTREEAIRSKNWAAGSHKQLKEKQYLFDIQGAALYEEITFPPSFHKIIDEPVVNALDQALKKCNVKKPVKNVQINFANGSIEIKDDGPGIPIEIQAETKVYIPEFCCAYFDQGSNNGEAKEDGIGGVNGLGLKLVNTLSTYFRIETCDGSRVYSQEWKNGKTVRGEPVITATKNKKTYTYIKFTPDYEFFGYTTSSSSSSASLYALIERLLITRATLASAYVNAYTKVGIYYNGAEIKIKKITDIAASINRLINGAGNINAPPESISCDMKMPYDGETLEVTYIITKTPITIGAALTNVNGVVVTAGKHIKGLTSALLKQIEGGLRKDVKKKKSDKFNISYLSKNLIVLCNAKLRNPNWTGQRKDYLDSDMRDSEITIPPKVIKAATAFVRDTIIENLYGKKKKSTTKIQIDKYRAADAAGSADSYKCTLFIVEGDSALAPVYTAIKNNKTLGTKYYGILCSGGVIINARKEIKTIKTSSAEFKQMSDKLTKNIFINSLMQACGLNYAYTYENQTELATLRYRYVCGAFDQDLDGNNIFGLTKNFIMLFWPNLIKCGFLQKLETPITRLYPKKGGEVIEFYHEKEYEDYARGPTFNAAAYDVRYYKGLSTNSNEEVVSMFSNCKKHIYTIEYDARAQETVEIYYGKDTALRKIELAKPLETSYNELLARRTHMKITCTDYLKNDVKPFQLDNLLRKLDSAIDGMNQSGRKIFHGSRKYFAKAGKKDVKAEQLAGFIANREIYHHGDTNLGKSIIGKTKLMVGGTQIPQMIATGQSGSRLEGGDDCGEPRYVGIKFNGRCMDILYPPRDYYLLDFIFDEGRRGEPKYYVPIIPMIVESHSLPGTAWKMQVWARDVFEVIDVTRGCIAQAENENAIRIPNISFCMHNFKGDIRRVGTNYASFGTYKIVTDKHLVITELPLKVWTNKYEKAVLHALMENEDTIKSIKNESDTKDVEIHVQLREGALEQIRREYGQQNALGVEIIDPIEDYFHLYNIMSETANFIGANNEVLELSRSEEVINVWFPIRKKMYAARIERETIIARMRLLHTQNIIKYLTDEKYIIKCSDEETMNGVFKSKGYPALNTGVMKDPKFIANADIWREFTERGTYDYLMELKERDKTDRHVQVLQDKGLVLKNELEKLQESAQEKPFPGASMWLKELSEFEAIVKEGLATNWLYDEFGKWKR